MQNSKLKFKIQNLFFVSIIGFIFFPTLVFGAILYLEPASGEYHQEDIFLVKIKIDPEEECINTISGNLKFSQETLKFVDFSNGNSILKLWPGEPKVDENLGSISFVGGIPQGFCGGENNLIGEIVFQTVSGGLSSAIEFLENSQVLLNDGKGTPAKLTTKGATFKIFSEKAQVPKNEWQEKLEKDKKPPEPFEIKISRDPSIFEGKYFIVFSTFDKETGIDHYEVKEGEENWKKTRSPYLLEDQSLKSKIFVKAIDKAGNERIAQILPSSQTNFENIWPMIISSLFVAGIIFWLFRKLQTKKLL